MSELVTVDIPQGRLQGRRVTSPTTGLIYYSFQGIPYAKPPVGPLRFKAPEEHEGWTGTRDATVEGAVSLQFDTKSGQLVGNEDCLFLNVYTPQWPAKSAKAVMVWIHGGGFTYGSGNTDEYGPDFLVAEDVIIVTINYRLGLLGFLHLEGADITANNGLRDQLLALKWVRSNIAQFGGDPNNVTIFGESAGGFSVHFLTITPLAAGLFQRAIIQSGTALLPRCIVSSDVSKARALRLAKLLGCNSRDPQQVALFLSTVPAHSILANQVEALSQQEDGLKVKSPPFLPSEESGSHALVPDSVRTLLEEGHFTTVPVMIGVTSAEGKVFLLGGASYKDVLSDIEKDFQYFVPLDLDPVPNTDRTKEIAEAIKKFYFGDQHLDDNAIVNYFEMMTDVFFVYPMHQTVQLQLRWSQHPTYVYLFDHTSSDVKYSFPVAGEEFPGSPHAAELPYLFQSSLNPNKFPPGSEDAEVQSTMVKLWTQFAKTGNPSTEPKTLTWTPASQENAKYLKINGGFNLETNLFKQRIEFLSNLYEKYRPEKR